MFNNALPIELDFSDGPAVVPVTTPALVVQAPPKVEVAVPRPLPTDVTPVGEVVEGDKDKQVYVGNPPSSDSLSFDLEDPGPDDTGEGSELEQDIDATVEMLVKVANNLADTVFGGELKTYEGFDSESELTEESVTKLIEYNLELSNDAAINEFVATIPPKAQRILDFSLNATTDAEFDSFLSTLIEENNIKSLDLTNEFDQEKIVRTWYNNEGWSSSEIDEKIGELKQGALLVKEAGRIKPKLDAKVEEIASKKEEGQRELKQMEVARRQEYLNRVGTMLQKNKVGNLQLSQDEANKLASYMTADQIEIDLPTGGKATMPYLEALISYHRNSPKANIENLAMATLLLTDREAFDKKYKKMVETTVTNEIVKDLKYDTNIKGGRIKVENKKLVPTPQANKWSLKINSPG